jgi:hypothetical protein
MKYHEPDSRTKAQISKARITYRKRIRAFLVAYLVGHPCVDCGESDPVVLEFDHVRGTKVAAISSFVRNMASMNRILAEIAKCDVRCANCHRRRTAAERMKPQRRCHALGR